MVHRGQLDNPVLFDIILPLKLQKVLVRVHKDSQLFVVLLSPFCHDHKDIFPSIQMLLKNDVLLVAVLSIDPMVPSIILFLNQKASHPDILGYPALPVKSVLLLPDVYRTLCLLEKSESPQRNGVIWWDLYVPSLLLLCLLGSRLDNLRRVDWACHRTAVLLERVDEDS